MEDWKGRAVQDTGRVRLRSSGSSAVPPADQYSKDSTARGDTNRSSHRTLPASVQVETAPGKSAGQKDHRHKASGARAERSTTPKRKANMVTKVSSVQDRNVSRPITAARRYGKRSSAGNKARMGAARVRGGASHPCPKCAAVTRVLRTTKVDETVQRHRQCLHCHHEYTTTEREL